MAHRIVVVTPAGRMRYLELLKYYILKDASIDEWVLWDNCRDPLDREYINQLEKEHLKIRVIRLENVDGTNLSVNRFYSFCKDESAFYIKMDDDIVYLPEQFGLSLYMSAMKERDQFLWWSPMVINNAICSWLLKYHSKVEIRENVSCQAGDFFGWRDPEFAETLHRTFLARLKTNDVQAFSVANFTVSLSRFSINCLGFFGEDVKKYDQQFCPLGVDDEEWLSAFFPSAVGKSGRIVGNLVISHFSFFTQERELLDSKILEQYYDVVGLVPPPYEIKKSSLKQRARFYLLKRLHGGKRKRAK